MGSPESAVGGPAGPGIGLYWSGRSGCGSANGPGCFSVVLRKLLAVAGEILAVLAVITVDSHANAW